MSPLSSQNTPAFGLSDLTDSERRVFLDLMNYSFDQLRRIGEVPPGALVDEWRSQMEKAGIPFETFLTALLPKIPVESDDVKQLFNTPTLQPYENLYKEEIKRRKEKRTSDSVGDVIKGIKTQNTPIKGWGEASRTSSASDSPSAFKAEQLSTSVLKEREKTKILEELRNNFIKSDKISFTERVILKSIRPPTWERVKALIDGNFAPNLQQELIQDLMSLSGSTEIEESRQMMERVYEILDKVLEGKLSAKEDIPEAPASSKTEQMSSPPLVQKKEMSKEEELKEFINKFKTSDKISDKDRELLESIPLSTWKLLKSVEVDKNPDLQRDEVEDNYRVTATRIAKQTPSKKVYDFREVFKVIDKVLGIDKEKSK